MPKPKLKQPTLTRYREVNPEMATTQPRSNTYWNDIINFIVGHEGRKMEGGYHVAYQNKDDKPTIGYGTTNSYWVNKGRISEAQARQAMYYDLLENEKTLRKRFKDYDTYPDEAKLVLHDILYNVGPGTFFEKSPKFMAAMRRGDWAEASRQMDWGNNQSGFQNGLRKRNSDRQAKWASAFNLNQPSEEPTYVRPQFQPPVIKMPAVNNEYNPKPHQGDYPYLDRNTYPEPNPIQPWEYLNQNQRMFRQKMLNNIQELMK